MLADAYARLVAMKIFAARSTDYFRSASEDDRRFLLFNPITKAKVTSEGERVIDLLWDVIAARGFERDTYFSRAASDIRALPKLEGTVHVNGEFRGEIRSEDTLVVGEGAHVEGEIRVGTAIVTGEVVGTIQASEVVELRAPARVKGTIITPALIVERGVLVDGSTRMADRDAKNSK
jgi:cytoskeletal protein CcmA (bactofilin family)